MVTRREWIEGRRYMGLEMLAKCGIRIVTAEPDPHAGRDADIENEIYHEDAVLEFPQSGRRFEGVANFREWRRIDPAATRFEIRRWPGTVTCGSPRTRSATTAAPGT